jgi:4-amino-4-deoxy-L-arabinose transferase-like glycosyltransferase
VLSSIGCVAAAAGILWVNVRELTWQKDTITLLTLILGLLAAFSLAMVAWKRKGCARPSCLFHALVTVYLMFHLVSQYRLWSSESQLLIYFFPLMASIFLMLSAYHSAVLDLRKERRSGFVFFSQAALFCCMMCCRGSDWLFYLSGALWVTFDTPSAAAKELSRDE